MCFSGRPFLLGIHIFFRGFWVSSRGDLSSSIVPSGGEVAAAAGTPTRGSFPWCCSDDGDRCFIRAAARNRWRWWPAGTSRSSLYTLCCHVLLRSVRNRIDRNARGNGATEVPLNRKFCIMCASLKEHELCCKTKRVYLKNSSKKCKDF